MEEAYAELMRMPKERRSKLVNDYLKRVEK